MLPVFFPCVSVVNWLCSLLWFQGVSPFKQCQEDVKKDLVSCAKCSSFEILTAGAENLMVFYIVISSAATND